MGKDAIMKILAVDYGASRTGLATCDASEFLTTAITPQITLKARPKVAARVCEIAAEIHAELIVVGLPLNMDGTEGERAEKSRKLAKTLQIWSGLPAPMCPSQYRNPPSTSKSTRAVATAETAMTMPNRFSTSSIVRLTVFTSSCIFPIHCFIPVHTFFTAR